MEFKEFRRKYQGKYYKRISHKRKLYIHLYKVEYDLLLEGNRYFYCDICDVVFLTNGNSEYKDESVILSDKDVDKWKKSSKNEFIKQIKIYEEKRNGVKNKGTHKRISG